MADEEWSSPRAEGTERRMVRRCYYPEECDTPVRRHTVVQGDHEDRYFCETPRPSPWAQAHGHIGDNQNRVPLDSHINIHTSIDRNTTMFRMEERMGWQVVRPDGFTEVGAVL